MSDEEKIIDQQNEAKVTAWNKFITPRLDYFRSLMSGEDWKKGVGGWLETLREDRTQHLKRKSNTREDDCFIKGQIAMLDEILELPSAIERHIAATENAKKQAKSRGSAGY